jgi:hypothetical protein
MLRVVLINLLLLFLPSIIYAAYIYLAHRDGAPGRPLDDAPVFWLFGIGVVLMLVTLIYYVQFSGGGKPGQFYVPPAYKDGKIVPGHFE